MNISPNVESYLNHFEVTLELIQKIIAEALSKGGDYADLFFEHSISHSLGLQDGEVNKAHSNIDYGVGIRVLKDDQTGYAYSESITEKDLIIAARTASNIANSSSKNEPASIHEYSPPSYYKINNSWETALVQDKIPFLQELNSQVFALDKRVTKVNASLNDETSYILFCNSEGLITYDYRPMMSIGAVCIMQDGDRIENSYAARAFRKGFEYISNDVVNMIAKEVVDRTKILFDAVKPISGEMPVVMAAGGSGILLHEAIGHAFEADFNRKGTSIFADKLGKKIAEDFITIVDDGTLENNRGSLNVDDEGNETQRTYMVKNGILNSFLHDRISSKFYKVNPTGNGRRESFRHVPIPRMRATYMENGNVSEADIISEVKNGIYVDNFSNGQVNIGAGDFTFFVKSGYLIENGKLTQPIKDINIIGNGPQALADITMAANNASIDNGTWTCGKDGQGIPVTCGLPSVLVKKLTVGGN